MFDPLPPLDPPSGHSLTNGDFAHPPLGKGFDWRVTPHLEISFSFGGAPAIHLSGKQPESVEILHQWVPLLGGARYRLRGGCDAEGLQWELVDRPPRDGRYKLALHYRRQPGTVRAEGSFPCRPLVLEKLP
ncbi:MAG: hypothetical protein HYR60_30460 [Acidobacteria bacterium]|nr:hypothetical protein [Acidobacteriota bacterium]